MIGEHIEAWQLSILVTAGIVLVEAALNALLRRRVSFAVHQRFRTVALGALLLLTVVVFVAALGPSLADELSSVAAAVAAVVALWLTYRSYQSPRDTDLGGTGAPEAPLRAEAQPHQPPPPAPGQVHPPESRPRLEAATGGPAIEPPPAGDRPPPGLPTQPAPSGPAAPPASGPAGPPAPRKPLTGRRLRRLLLGRRADR